MPPGPGQTYTTIVLGRIEDVMISRWYPPPEYGPLALVLGFLNIFWNIVELLQSEMPFRHNFKTAKKLRARVKLASELQVDHTYLMAKLQVESYLNFCWLDIIISQNLLCILGRLSPATFDR